MRHSVAITSAGATVGVVLTALTVGLFSAWVLAIDWPGTGEATAFAESGQRNGIEVVPASAQQ